MKIVVDSSIIIDYLRGGLNWNNFINSAEKKDIELFLPTVVIFELFSGTSTRKPQEIQNITNFIKQFQRIDLNEDIARLAGQLFRDIKIKLGAADYLIAASALGMGATILTLNKKHFEGIPHLALYPI